MLNPKPSTVIENLSRLQRLMHTDFRSAPRQRLASGAELGHLFFGDPRDSNIP